jgi:hypothetical protein
MTMFTDLSYISSNPSAQDMYSISGLNILLTLLKRYFATAIGKNKASAKTELEKIDFKSITAKEAVYLIAKM